MDPPHLGVLLSDLTLLFPCSAPILPLLIAFCCPPPTHPWLFNRFSIIILPLLLIYFCGFAVANWATNKPHDRDHRQSIDTIWGGLIKLSSKKSALILSKRQQNWQQPWQILKRTTLCGCNCHDCLNYEAKSREENKRSRKVEVEVEKTASVSVYQRKLIELPLPEEKKRQQPWASFVFILSLFFSYISLPLFWFTVYLVCQISVSFYLNTFFSVFFSGSV